MISSNIAPLVVSYSKHRALHIIKKQCDVAKKRCKFIKLCGVFSYDLKLIKRHTLASTVSTDKLFFREHCSMLNCRA